MNIGLIEFIKNFAPILIMSSCGLIAFVHSVKQTEKKTSELSVTSKELTSKIEHLQNRISYLEGVCNISQDSLKEAKIDVKNLTEKNEKLLERVHTFEKDFNALQKVCQERHSRGKLIV
ncbi:MAG: hypothetical protein Ta2B_05530 [Termitinemataceae bacterium]|nr:MAG: hypothetical protein Ta2B_05530 [Termitinemataceae bacterium]